MMNKNHWQGVHYPLHCIEITEPEIFNFEKFKT